MRRIEVEKVQCAMNGMKIRKANGPSGVAIELFKSGGDKCLKSLRNIFNDIWFKDKLPEEWMLGSLVPVFKGKGNPLIQIFIGESKSWNMLLNCTRKFWMGVLCEVVDINTMQYRLMPQSVNVDVVFVLRRLSEKFKAKNKLLFYIC